MGHLDRGTWNPKGDFPTDKGGAFARAATTFRDPITEAAAGRYHLYVSYACPWAHRTLVARALLGLDDAISVSVVNPFMGDDGWTFDAGDGVVPDPIHGARTLWQVYVAAKPDYSGRVTVPTLWDRERNTIVNNESREILRALSTVFAPLGHGRGRVDLAPPALRPSIDATIDAMYSVVNNGVYRAGFAKTQAAHEHAIEELFTALDAFEIRLGDSRFLCGDRPTEADICLFTTLFRFDIAYHGHFKCNVRRIVDYPNLWGFTRDVYQLDGVAATCKVDHCKQHYYRSHPNINPTRIVPVGPAIDYASPHGRGAPIVW
jgi:putative glutathione S-transferase